MRNLMSKLILPFALAGTVVLTGCDAMKNPNDLRGSYDKLPLSAAQPFKPEGYTEYKDSAAAAKDTILNQRGNWENAYSDALIITMGTSPKDRKIPMGDNLFVIESHNVKKWAGLKADKQYPVAIEATYHFEDKFGKILGSGIADTSNGDWTPKRLYEEAGLEIFEKDVPSPKVNLNYILKK